MIQSPYGGGNNTIVEGHGRLEALKQLGYTEVDCIRLDHLTDEERKAYTLAHNKINMNTGFDIDLLDEELDSIEDIDMSDFGFLDNKIEFDNNNIELEKYTLSDLFLFNPFSVLDGRTGDWQNRKKQWLDFGIKSEIGRNDNLMKARKSTNYVEGTCTYMAPSTSIFDPVICELMYKWFNVDGGSIYDCFAGGSVRGIVAQKLGYKYYGIDLREEQINANYDNARELNLNPTWYCDDSLNVDKYIEDNSIDMIFSCPPYADLEVYSDDERDISNMPYDKFIEVYRKIIKKACLKLKKDRFAVFVVGDVRDKKGFYYDFISDTKKAFIDNGCLLYNELIKIDPNGTAGLRAKKTFTTRKCVKVHQNILVFYKGDVRKIKSNYVDIEFKYEIL